MRINVWVRWNSKSNVVFQTGMTEYRASVRAGPAEVDAALVEVLAAFFSIPRTWVQIVPGHGGNLRIVDVSGV